MPVFDPLRYFELSPTDRAMAVLHEESPFTPQLGMEFDALLDHAKLEQALGLLTRRHPILTATVDLASWQARWQRATTAPEFVEVFDEPGDRFASAPALAALQARALDPTTGPTCQVTHLHDGARSRLVFGVHHAVADGHGILLMLDDLRMIYEALQCDDVPVVDVDWNLRTVGALLDAEGVTADERVRQTWELMQRWLPVPRSTHQDAIDADGSAPGSASAVDATMQFDDVLVGIVDAGARSRGWRLNHVMLALLARAWSRVVGREPVVPSVSGWLVTVDCRRQFRVPRGAGNLSGVEPVSLLDVESRELLDVIEHARSAFEPLARRGAGLAADFTSPLARFAPPPVFDRAIRDTFALRTRTLRYSRLYSHTDQLPASLTRWGDRSATGLRWIAARHIAPPYMAMVLVRFAGVTSITPFASAETLPADCVAGLAVELRAGLEDLAAQL